MFDKTLYECKRFSAKRLSNKFSIKLGKKRKRGILNKFLRKLKQLIRQKTLQETVGCFALVLVSPSLVEKYC